MDGPSYDPRDRAGLALAGTTLAVIGLFALVFVLAIAGVIDA